MLIDAKVAAYEKHLAEAQAGDLAAEAVISP